MKTIHDLSICFNVIFSNKTKYPEAVKMSQEDRNNFKHSTTCFYCGKTFNNETIKVLDHCHFTGKFRGASCSQCNLREGIESKVIPIIFS